MSAVRLNTLADDEALAALGRCCGARRWMESMLAGRPFADDAALFAKADAAWAEMGRADILEAFEHHPRIGTDIDELRDRFARTATLSASEQRSVATASEAVLTALRDGNVRYEERYGHIFIVCATGKSAEQMLTLLEARMHNDPEVELRIAAEEQRKITRLRLEKL